MKNHTRIRLRFKEFKMTIPAHKYWITWVGIVVAIIAYRLPDIIKAIASV